MSERQTGTVKWFNNAKGYGFIEQQGHGDIFVHYRNVRGEGYRSLRRGATVEFVIVQGPKGEHADDVVETGPPPSGGSSETKDDDIIG